MNKSFLDYLLEAMNRKLDPWQVLEIVTLANEIAEQDIEKAL